MEIPTANPIMALKATTIPMRSMVRCFEERMVCLVGLDVVGSSGSMMVLLLLLVMLVLLFVLSDDAAAAAVAADVDGTVGLPSSLPKRPPISSSDGASSVVIFSDMIIVD